MQIQYQPNIIGYSIVEKSEYSLFSLLGIFMFSFPVWLNASETDELGILISQASGEHKNEQTSSGPNNQHTFSNGTLQSRWDIYGLLFGINSVGLILRSPGAAMVANNVMSIVGILVVGINILRPGLGITRKPWILRAYT